MINKVLSFIWTNCLWPLIIYGLIWAGFRYWLDFNTKQSIVFAVLVGSGYFSLKELSRKSEKTDDFIPYRVTVTCTDWHKLLFKYKFVKSEEEWKQLSENVEKTSLFRRGFNFTVLSLDSDGLPHLTWWDDHKIFLAGMPSFEESISELEFDAELLGWTTSPHFYFGYRHGRKQKGYHLALSVGESWWDKNVTPDTANIEVIKKYDTGSVYLILGTLPYGELGLEYKKRGQDRKKELAARGWTVKDYHEPEMAAFDTIEVQNEFFSVSQHYCETQ